MIAINVLRDAQRIILEQEHVRRRIRCFFSEHSPEAFAQLQAAVSSFHAPEEDFEIRTYCGEFQDAVPEIQEFVSDSFALIFIDPTGWTGYPLDKIRPLFLPRKREVLVNFMYDHVNRFASSEDEQTIASLSPILGGPDWRERLDTTARRGLAVEKLFRGTLKSVGSFSFVISTKIDKATADRPYFFIIYGTKSLAGLKEFRQTEYNALRQHARARAGARERRRAERLNVDDLFASHEAEVQEATIDEIVGEQIRLASADLIESLQTHKSARFSNVVAAVLEAYMLRETNVKDICVNLAKAGEIGNTWGGGNRKPRDDTIIRLKSES